VSPKFSRQCLFVRASADRDCSKTHLASVLNPQMTKTANALHGHQVARTSSCVSQRIKNCDAGADQRTSFIGGQGVWYCRNRFGRSNHVLGIAAIEANPSDLRGLAINKVAAPAWIALETVTAVPTNADTPAWFPKRHVWADRVNATSYFVPRDAWIFNSRPMPFFYQYIAVADAAGLDLNTHLPTARLRDRTLNHLKISSRAAYLDSFHFVHAYEIMK
jgi:hypothetical protein